jgi:flagellar motor switch protein FliN/FliY
VVDDSSHIDPTPASRADDPATGVPEPTQDGASSSVEGTTLDQPEIEALLSKAAGLPRAAGRSEPASPLGSSSSTGSGADVEDLTGSRRASPRTTANPEPQPSIAEKDVEFLLSQAEQALSSIHEPNAELPAGISPFELKSFTDSSSSHEVSTVDLVRDVQLDLNIELGRTHLYLEDVLKLRKGSVVSLDSLAGDPVDIYANGRLIARGEVLVLNDNFCVRVAELVMGKHLPIV